MPIFYCFYFVEEISTDMVEKQVMEEIDPDIEGEEYFRNSDDMEEHWKEGEE